VNLQSNNRTDEPGRKNPAAGVHVQIGQSNLVLLTVTTEDRNPWLANETAHKFLRETWQAATAWLAGDYLLMPDHLHVFCAPHDLAFTIEQWITFWKRDFRRRHEKAEWSFQSRGWHHRLRAGEDYAKKWIYVQENPVRKKLVNRIEDWPFKGNVHQLPW
jgi:putative transposase